MQLGLCSVPQRQLRRNNPLRGGRRRKINQTRRLKLEQIITRLKALRTDLGEEHQDEQEYYDNMPESLQAGVKGELAQEAADHLQEAMDAVSQAVAEIGYAVL